MLPVVYSPAYQTYNFGEGHPFTPIRQAMLTELLRHFSLPLDWIVPPVATREDVRQVHAEDFVEAVERAAAGDTDVPWCYGLGTSDVPFFAGMDQAARVLVGGTLEAARRIASGAGTRVLQLGGGLHHAMRDRAAGFCVYNDVAVAIEHLRQQGLRVAYVDVDVHHGDGVQALFYDTPDVLTISLHQDGQTLFPGTGGLDELGEGAGRGFSLNVPLLPGLGDDAYLDAFESVVPHALAWFQPDVLVVEAGADAHGLDPLAGLNLTTYGFEQVFRRIVALAGQHAQGRLLVTLGGGYHPDSALRVWLLLLHVLADLPLPEALPQPWRETWQQRLGIALSPRLHDAGPSTTPPAEALAARATTRALLERAAGLWM